MQKAIFNRRWAIWVFAAGFLLGLLFTGFSGWADLEASTFDSLIIEQETITSLSCPVLITPKDTGLIRFTAANHTDYNINAWATMLVTHKLISVERNDRLTFPLSPGETYKGEFKVYADDAVWNHFILLRVRLYAYPQPTQMAACGVLTVNIPFLSGNVLLVLILLLSLAGMLAGWLVWVRSNPPLRGIAYEIAVAMAVLAVVCCAGLVFSILGMWLVGSLTFALGFMLVVVILAHFALVL